MVERGVQFDDAIHEFEKRFISRVLGCCDGSLIRTADTLGHPPQHAHPQNGRVQDQETRSELGTRTRAGLTARESDLEPEPLALAC